MSAAAIKATFADWRTVKGRKMLQLVFEVPLEQQGEVLSMLGAPMPDAATWCAIALLNEQAPPQEVGEHPEPEPLAWMKPARGAKSEGERARIRSVILCGDQRFLDWMGCTAEQAPSVIRGYLGIKSRAEIATDPEMLRRFKAMETSYLISTNQMAEPR